MYTCEAELRHLGLDASAQTYMLELLQGIYKGYSGNVAQKLKLEELRVEHEPSASSSEAAEKSTPRRLLGSVLTCSIPVTEDMVNVAGGLHGGCQAYLVDLCTSLAMVPFRSVESWDVTGLSLNLSVNYLSAARTGSTLRILSRTANVGRNIASVGCRIETVPHQHDADPDVASTAVPTPAGAHPETAVPSSKQGKVVATGSHLKFNAFAATKGKREASLKERQQRVQSVDGSKAPSSHITASAL